MITILSPAKKLNEWNEVPFEGNSQPVFQNEANELVRELQKLTPDDIANLMDISDDLAKMNFERYAKWDPESPERKKQAIFLYNGQAYLGLDAKTLNKEDLIFAQDHLRILSGLYGILRPLDLIQPHRLEMGTKLNNAKGKDLYQFWNEKVTQSLNETLKNHDQNVLINLASNEYYKVIDKKKSNFQVITPVFKETKGDKLQTVAVYAKTARGKMSRYIIKHKINDPEMIKAFDEDNYLFNPDLSTDKEWVFTR